MRIIICLLLYITCFVATANNEELEEAAKLYTHSDNEVKLKICSDKGNDFCSGLLGEKYYNDKKYNLAYPLLLKCSKKVPFCDLYLGQMFSNGEGVLQNDEKAIKHLENAARGGFGISAYNLGVKFSHKAYPYAYSFTSQEVNQYKYNLARSYAWYKVSMALGEKDAESTNGHIEPLLDHINSLKNKLVAINYLSEADTLAKEICSGISECTQ